MKREKFFDLFCKTATVGGLVVGLRAGSEWNRIRTEDLVMAARVETFRETIMADGVTSTDEVTAYYELLKLEKEQLSRNAAMRDLNARMTGMGFGAGVTGLIAKVERTRRRRNAWAVELDGKIKQEDREWRKFMAG